MDHATRVAAVERELATLIAAVQSGPADARVPTCPDWAVADLADHVGLFCRRWNGVLADGPPPEGSAFAAAGQETDPIGALPGLADELVDRLRGTDPATPAWTWLPEDQTVGFIARRAVHEVTIHRVDAQLARGAHDPIDPAIAVDGIEEVFVLLQHPMRGAPSAHGETVHLHGTDRDDAEWLITLGPDTIDVAREHAKGDLAVQATASDLELLVYQRPTHGEVRTFGDEAVLAALYREFTF
jgi:uncharacterized protein (TIGR03083 family)